MPQKGLDLLAGRAAGVLDVAHQRELDEYAMNQMLLREQAQRRFQERLAQERRLFEAGENQKTRTASRELAEYKEEATAARERAAIEAGKYDKTGRYAYWTSLRIDPKAKMLLGGTENTLKELYDIETVMRNKIFITPQDRSTLRNIQSRIRQLETRKNVIYETYAPNIWKKIQTKLGEFKEETPSGVSQNDDPLGIR